MTYTEHFQKIVEDQLARVEKLKNSSPVPDFAAKEKSSSERSMATASAGDHGFLPRDPGKTAGR